MAASVSVPEHAQQTETSPIAFATGPLIDAAEALFKLCKRDNLTELSVSHDRGSLTYAVTIRVDLRSPDAAITITRRPFHA
jgi:hypothetical protein